MFKQNSLITRYCLAVAVMLTLLGPLAQNGRCDFILYNDEQLTVNSFHNQGTLFDTSRVFIVSGGYGYDLYAYNYSTVNISGGQSYVGYLWAYNSSTVNMSGGSGYYLDARDSSTVNISDGTITSGLEAHNSSTVNISGGTITSGLGAYNSSTVNISGGSITSGLGAYNSSTVNISGGSMNGLYANPSSTVTFYGQNFHYGSGLTLDGTRVLGTGMLSGEWMNGTRWVVNISNNDPTATIRVIPEPAPPFVLNQFLAT